MKFNVNCMIDNVEYVFCAVVMVMLFALSMHFLGFSVF